jgi:hypothetical protein
MVLTKGIICGQCGMKLESALTHHDYDECKSHAHSKRVDGNKWIYFDIAGATNKTQKWDVVNKSSEEPLARIEWYPNWRQYVMFPEPNTVFNDGCLDTINAFIKRLNRDKQI